MRVDVNLPLDGRHRRKCEKFGLKYCTKDLRWEGNLDLKMAGEVLMEWGQDIVSCKDDEQVAVAAEQAPEQEDI